jgi:hypothetical protein
VIRSSDIVDTCPRYSDAKGECAERCERRLKVHISNGDWRDAFVVQKCKAIRVTIEIFGNLDPHW